MRAKLHIEEAEKGWDLVTVFVDGTFTRSEKRKNYKSKQKAISALERGSHLLMISEGREYYAK